MKKYGTLLIGCGYFSVGYALAAGDCLIVEEHQSADVGFYLPMRSFRYSGGEPRTEAGRQLLGALERYGAIDGGRMNTAALEGALCSHILDTGIEILLKCRVIERERDGDGYTVTLSTNEGLSHIRVEKIVDTRDPSTARRSTVMLLADSGEAESVASVFPGATVEPAFYGGQYALHIPVLEGEDENAVKERIISTLGAAATSARILCIAPVFYGEGASPLCDGAYADPVAAEDAGYLYGRRLSR